MRMNVYAPRKEDGVTPKVLRMASWRNGGEGPYKRDRFPFSLSIINHGRDVSADYVDCEGDEINLAIAPAEKGYGHLMAEIARKARERRERMEESINLGLDQTGYMAKERCAMLEIEEKAGRESMYSGMAHKKARYAENDE